MDFVKSTDIFKLKRFLNAHVLVGDRAGKGAGATQIGVQPTKDGRTGLFDMIGDNASQIDAGKMEQALKSGSTNILLSEEKIELAFKCGRDSFCMTSHRFLQIDVQGGGGVTRAGFCGSWLAGTSTSFVEAVLCEDAVEGRF